MDKPKSKKQGSNSTHTHNRLLADNRLARHQYEILNTLETGIELLGTEVKSIRSGKVNLKALSNLLINFKEKKTTLRSGSIQSFDTQYFNFSFPENISIEDGAATLTEFTSQVIISAIKEIDHNIEEVILCGGGRKNTFLVERIKEKITKIKLIDEYKIDGDFVESQAFAYLAIRSYLKLPISFPETTGVKRPCVGGVLVKI